MRIYGGEQQRLLLARVLSLEPKILLLDEPTSALDLYSQNIIEELLIEIAHTHTLIMVSHNIDQALRIADSLAVMQTQKGNSNFLKVPKDKAALETALKI